MWALRARTLKQCGRFAQERQTMLALRARTSNNVKIAKFKKI